MYNNQFRDDALLYENWTDAVKLSSWSSANNHRQTEELQIAKCPAVGIACQCSGAMVPVSEMQELGTQRQTRRSDHKSLWKEMFVSSVAAEH